jgi:hypothetical protein
MAPRQSTKEKGKKKKKTPALGDDNFSEIMNNPSHINILLKISK